MKEPSATSRPNYFSFPQPKGTDEISKEKDKSLGTQICFYIAYLFKKINIFKFNRKNDLHTPLKQ